MISVYVPDVGDGLAAGFRTIGQETIQIDCGSQQCPDAAFEKGLCRIDPDVFVLSHFHVDHYNGLLHWRRSRHWPHPTIHQVFFPRMPEFPQKTQFMKCILSMAHWVMGDTTGSMEADFLGVLSKINFCSFTYQALSLGDTVRIGSSRIDVLWPPRIVEDERTLKVIRTAISDFESAAEEDEDLRRIREQIGERGEIHPYFGTDDEVSERNGRGEERRERDEPPFPNGQRRFPEAVRKANDSLRRAANHLSLAFHQDNRLLFMGDLESHEISQVVDHLLREGRDHFVVTITPHHGTHWHRDLSRLRSWWAMSSVGKGLFRHVSPEFKSMCDSHFITHLNGDIEVPLHFAPCCGPRFWRHWPTFT